MPTRDDRWSYFEQRMDIGDCWEWTGCISADGYGAAGKGWAHREMWRILVGPIPQGHEIDHLCKNRRCVNPEHLRPATRKENAANSVNFQANKTKCKRGHDRNDPANVHRDSRGFRNCRACERLRRRALRMART